MYSIVVINSVLGSSGIEPPDIIIDICSTKQIAEKTIKLIELGIITVDDVVNNLEGANLEEFVHYFIDYNLWIDSILPEFRIDEYISPKPDKLFDLAKSRVIKRY